MVKLIAKRMAHSFLLSSADKITSNPSKILSSANKITRNHSKTCWICQREKASPKKFLNYCLCKQETVLIVMVTCIYSAFFSLDDNI